MCKRIICLTCCALVLGLVNVATADLLVHYQLDETAGTTVADASGNGNDGTVGGVESWVDGKFGGAFEAWGTEYITLPAEKMGLTTTTGSFACWIKADAPSASINTLFWAGDSTIGGGFGPDNEFHVHIEQAVSNIWVGGELTFFAISDPDCIFLYSDPEKGGKDDRAKPPVNPVLVTDQQWHHIAATWDGGNNIARLYIDGSVIMESAYTPKTYDLSHIFLGQMAKGDRRYTGLLDDVRIYSNALTSEEVLNLFENNSTDVNDHAVSRPQEFALNQNYPNPFNPTTTIEYTLPANGYLSVVIYDLLGMEVRTLINEKKPAGTHFVQWDGTNNQGQRVVSGIYYYSLITETSKITKKCLLLK